MKFLLWGFISCKKKKKNELKIKSTIVSGFSELDDALLWKLTGIKMNKKKKINII